MTDPAARAAALLHLHHDGLEPGDPLRAPIGLSSMFHLPGDPSGLKGYGRGDNATWEAAEAALSHLEDAPSVLFPSGMAAITAGLMAMLKAGDRLILPSDGYYTTRLLSERVLERFGVEAEMRPTARMAEGGFDGVSLVMLETPSNPGLDLCDIAGIAAEVHAAGGRVICDNTTMTPLGQRPLDLGADVVVASDTKAPNGHSDVLAGHVATRDAELLERVRDWRKISGAIPGPMDAWLLLRGLETLEVRLSRMWATAETVADALAAHPKVERLVYPTRPDHPQADLAARQMSSGGTLIGLTLADAETATRFITGCPYLASATSFGGVHSSAERRARWGDEVPGGFVRLSIGCEPEAALVPALIEALDRA
ncbi:cystathionine gamma-lyase [Tropicimonas sp. IMCC34011]|uniref:cystathionine gamma-lyase n=1 Tax=Tropicimonas sp. IMCC34011 TaxID=2248759 RepID=UPI000E2631BB|nr:cystathionine gamma-lyase [Tropicimonas sp. IMCC34011]